MAHTRQDVDGFDKMSAEVAQAHFGLGLLHQHRAESREAAEQYSRAIEIFTRRHNVSECGAALVRCNLNLGNVQLDRSDPDAASRHFEVALEICQKLLQTQPSPEHRELLVRTEINVARVLNRQGWHQQAVGMFEEAIRRGEQLAGNHSTPNTLHALAIAYHDLGACHELIADKDAAIDNYEQAMEIGKKLVSENPFVPDYWDGLATAYSNLGRLNVDVDRDRSVRLLDNAIRIYERRPEMFSEVQLNKPLAKPAESAEFKVALSTCYITKAVIYGQRETQYALSLLEKAQNTLLSLSSDHPRIRSLLDHTRKLQTHIDPVQVEAPSVQARHPNQIAPGRTRTLSSQPR